MKKKNEVFFGEKGLTSTSAAHLSSIAQSLIADTNTKLASVKFYSTQIGLLGGSRDLLSIGRDSQFLLDIPMNLNKIAGMNAFCAWVKEAIKAKDEELAAIQSITPKEWCIDNNIPYPETPAPEHNITENDIIGKMSIKERHEYYTLEAVASTYGKYIHDRCPFTNAKTSFSKILSNPISKEGTGSDTIIYTYTPTVTMEEVENMEQQLMSVNRANNARLNCIKAEIRKQLADSELEKTARYREALEEYRVIASRILNDFREWQISETNRISKLKIVLPHDLEETVEYLNSLGKPKDQK